MKKINLKEISVILSEKELKDVVGGVTPQTRMYYDANEGGGNGARPVGCTRCLSGSNCSSKICGAKEHCGTQKYCY